MLGQVAGRELFGSPDVSKGMAELDNLVDEEKMEAVFGKKKWAGGARYNSPMSCAATAVIPPNCTLRREPARVGWFPAWLKVE